MAAFLLIAINALMLTAVIKSHTLKVTVKPAWLTLTKTGLQQVHQRWLAHSSCYEIMLFSSFSEHNHAVSKVLRHYIQTTNSSVLLPTVTMSLAWWICIVTTCRWRVLEVFGCVLEGLPITSTKCTKLFTWWPAECTEKGKASMFLSHIGILDEQTKFPKSAITYLFLRQNWDFLISDTNVVLSDLKRPI